MIELHKRLLVSHQFVLGLVFVISVLSFNSQAILYSVVSGLLLVQYYRQINQVSANREYLDDRRLQWILSQLQHLEGDYASNPDKLWKFLEESRSKSFYDLFNRELGIVQRPIEQIYVVPDLEEAENELVRSEERVSILLGSLVFLPVLFGLLHLFRSVQLITYLVELQIFLLLGQMVVLNQGQKYQYDGWSSYFKETETLRNKISKLGRQSMLAVPGLFVNPQLQELGLDVSISNDSPAQILLSSLVRHSIGLQNDKRKMFLEEALDSLTDLPKHESLLNLRWRAYKNRLYLIGIASVAISAQLASIANFAVPQFNSVFIILETTPFLSWGLLILSVGLNTIVLQNWITGKGLLTTTVVYSLLYLFVFFLNSILFV